MRLRRAVRAGIVVGAVALGAGTLLSVTADAQAPAGPVSATPVTTTPHLPPIVTAAQQIRQLVLCKGTMFAVGSFSTIEQNAMSFSAKAPYPVSSWAPKINGVVNSIAFNGSHCADAYIGGSFTKVNGTTVENLAEISTQTGAVVKTFGHSASEEVETLLGWNGHILAGGDYTSINGSTADPYLTSCTSPATTSTRGWRATAPGSITRRSATAAPST
jgi:hypothetical protein